MKIVEERARELIEEIRSALRQPPLALSSDPRAVAAIDPYRKLVALGEAALPTIISRLREFDYFLNDAVIEIAHISIEGLSLPDFPNEREVASALLDWLEPVGELFWTAVGSTSEADSVVAQAFVTTQHDVSQHDVSPVSKGKGLTAQVFGPAFKELIG